MEFSCLCVFVWARKNQDQVPQQDHLPFAASVSICILRYICVYIYMNLHIDIYMQEYKRECGIFEYRSASKARPITPCSQCKCICTGICIYIYIYIYVCICICICIYVYVYIPTYMYIHINMYIHLHIYLHLCTYIYICIPIYTYEYHTYMHTYTRMYTDIYTYVFESICMFNLCIYTL